jgi:PAS domain S-box-containing protein
MDMIRSALAGVLFVIALLAATSSRAGVPLTVEERAWLETHRDQIALGFDSHFPPFEFLAADKSFQGLGADVMALIEERLGVTFTKKPAPSWSKQLAALAANDIQIAPVIVRSKERAEYATFSAPYITVPVVVITRDVRRDARKLEDFTGQRVATVKGYVAESYLRDNYSDRFEIVTVSNIREGLRDTAFGVVDAFVENIATAAYYLEKENLPNLRVAGDTGMQDALSFAVNKEHPLLFSAMHKALEDITPEEMAALKKKWIPLASSHAISPEERRFLQFALVVSLLAFTVLFVLAWMLRRRYKAKEARLRKVEQALRESEAISLAIFNQAFNFFALLDLQGRILKINQSTRETLEYHDGLIGQYFWDAPWWPSASKGRQVCQQAMQVALKGEVFRDEIRCIDKNGEECYLDVAFSPLVNDDGEVIYFIPEGRDITEMKRFELALATSEKKYREIFTNAPIGIFRTAYQGYFLDANPSLARMLGFDSPEELMNRYRDLARDLYPRPEERQRLLTALRQKPDGVTMEIEFQRRDGSPVYSIIHAGLHMDEKGNPSFLDGTIEDITARKQAEKALRASEKKFFELFMLSPDSVNVSSIETGKILAVNESFLTSLGFTRDEVLGRTPSELGIIAGTKRREEMLEQIETTGRVENFEIQVFRKTGETLMYSLSARKLDIDGKPALMVMGRDVTEQKKMQEMMVQTEKMLSVGGIAAGIAHEINNPLGIILQTAQNMAQRIRPDFRKNIQVARDIGLDMDLLETYMQRRGIPGFVENIQAAALRAAVIIRHMLDFSRRSESKRTVCDLCAIIDKAVLLAASDYDLKKNFDFKQITVTKDFAEDIPSFPCTETEIEQVVLNLLRNAAQAMAASDPPTVDPEIRLRVTHDSKRIRLEITDNGPGIAPEVRTRIFEPFFTTKPIGQGTGLGLSVSYFIITKGHDGTMDVESLPGQGTTFIIELPLDTTRTDEET